MYKFTLCFIKREREILLLNRARPPMMGKWNGIGGKPERDETPYRCAVREMYEETGIVIDNPELAGIVTWITAEETSGMYVFTAAVPPVYRYETPVRTEEGLLDWKETEWILHPDNAGIADNVQQFLPDVLAGNRFDHRYTFDSNARITDYRKRPLAVELV